MPKILTDADYNKLKTNVKCLADAIYELDDYEEGCVAKQLSDLSSTLDTLKLVIDKIQGNITDKREWMSDRLDQIKEATGLDKEN